MLAWVIQDGEPLPGIDLGARDWRAAMLSRALVARGHEVLWWASTFDHAQKRHRFDHPTVVEIQPGLKVWLLHGPGYGHNKSPKRFLHQRILARQFAAEAVSQLKPDVIFGSLPTVELVEQAAAYGKNMETPVIIDVRDLWPDHYLTLVPERWRSFLRILLQVEFRRARRGLSAVTGVTAISDSFLSWGLYNAGRRQTKADGVFPMGYPSCSPSDQIIARQTEIVSYHNLKTENLIVAFVGSLNSIFDFETVLDAARVLDDAGQEDVQFVLVGDGSNGAQVRSLAQGLRNVVLTGWFDQTSIQAVLSLASVGLAPYAEGRSVNGSMPNKSFEYMSFGLPLLSSLRGELEDLIRNEQIGLQYQAGDVDSLVERIRWLAANPAERIAIGRRARKLFEERFSADIIYPRLVAHLEQVAANAITTNSGKSRLQRKA